MLLAIRSQAQSWVMWVIVILLIVPFALWGVHQYFGPEPDVAVAEVEGRELTAREFENTYQRQRQRLRMMLEGQGGLSAIDDKRLREETLQSMIDEELLVQTGLDGGMRVSDEQLAAAIRQLEVFQEEGRFSQERYEYWITTMGFGPGSFEHTLRRNMLQAQLQRGITDSALVTDRALAEASRLADQRRSFGLLTIPMERFKDPAAVTAQAIEDYYRANEAEFTIPERLVVRYLELSKERIAEGITIDEEAARRQYESFKTSYVAPEQRRASHILLTVPPGADGDAIEAVRSRAEALRAEIEAGADFAALAREHSEDLGSAAQGGDLGYFERGATAPLLDEPLFPAAFEDAVFSMAVGEVSAPVRSEDGFHIIRLEDIRAGGTKTFEDVREQVVAEMRSVRAEEQFYDQAERFANMVYENVDTLEVAADALELEIRTSAPFSREGGEGIFADPRVITAAFSEDVAQGMNSEPLELDDLHLVALRLAERIPPQLQPLEQVADDIRERLARQQARAAAAARGEELMSRLRAGVGGATLAEENGFRWRDVEGATRRSDTLAEEVVDEVFRLPRPDGTAVVDGLTLADGDYAVLVLKTVTDGGDLPAQAAERRRTLLGQMQGEEQFEAVMQRLRERADITINRSEFSQAVD